MSEAISLKGVRLEQALPIMHTRAARMSGDTLVTLPDIQLISVGSWKAGGTSPGKSGEVVFTEQDLKDIIASQDAPDVKEPRMILGHTAPTDGPAMSEVSDEGFFGEQPAIGKFTNLSLTADGQEIRADLVGVPKWLADILPTAYSNRSVEVYWDVPSGIPGAGTHACIMPRVALLGTNLPAVATLEDLKVFFSEDGPEIEADLSKASKRVAASKGEPMPNRVAASVQYEDVRRDFYNNFATEESGRYWWWINSVYVDPAILIVDDDAEGLWSVPYTVDGDEITFGDPVSIKVQYVEEDSGKVAASTEVPPEAGKKYAKAAASRPANRSKKETKMGLNLADLRSRTGLTVEQLPDDATEEQINTALAAPDVEKPENKVEPEAGANAAPGAVPSEGAPAEGAPAKEEPVATTASAQSGTVTVDRAAWEEQQKAIAALQGDLNTRVAAARNSTVVDAIKAGKIPPSRKDHYVKLMTADPEGTTELLAGLEAVIPVDQRESGVADPSEGGSAAASADYDLAWLNDPERARVEAVRAGSPATTPRLVLEG